MKTLFSPVITGFDIFQLLFLTYILCLDVEAHVHYVEPTPQPFTNRHKTFNLQFSNTIQSQRNELYIPIIFRSWVVLVTQGARQKIKP